MSTCLNQGLLQTLPVENLVHAYKRRVVEDAGVGEPDGVDVDSMWNSMAGFWA